MRNEACDRAYAYVGSIARDIRTADESTRRANEKMRGEADRKVKFDRFFDGQKGMQEIKLSLAALSGATALADTLI